MIRLIVTAAALALQAGCATNTATWRHPARAGDGHDGATMALAECQRYASGSGPAPMPTARMDTPAPTSYTTRGTYTQYGSYGTYRGTTTANGGFDSGFASGYNSGAAIGDAIASIQFQSRLNEIAAACMRTQGWIDTSTPEGQEKFKQGIASLATAKTASRQSAADKAARDEWVTTIGAFMDTESARPGGIDYRTDKAKQAALDKYVKELANDPANAKQRMSWFLTEAHKKVLADTEQYKDAAQKRIEDAIEGTFDFEASRKNGIHYRSDKQKRDEFFSYVEMMFKNPKYDDWKEIAITMWANERIREKFGIKD